MPQSLPALRQQVARLACWSLPLHLYLTALPRFASGLYKITRSFRHAQGGSLFGRCPRRRQRRHLSGAD
jgi:hypothetical protein